ncbi:MAG: CHC2 zinc finger domain-containing protein [Methylicorpusculum sp.]|uniref:CHC2 zinc finger domain-containing protein n=1 Tax=Methylicorpusculum sp. TaxID=2713644 RepID=UPI002731767E|nr:CHC2 zinc finger domain-containing protein [Methylicorpusculum sp.]MDP2201772.1 CHC2 zinc finger domain-containing protein [Methylicorpusculum sp.]
MTSQRKTARYCNTTAAKKQNMSADYIKQTIKPGDFYRYELPSTPLKKQGWNDGGLCPFHSDNKPGSFRVNLLTGAYKCFSCGAAGGDIVAFIMALYAMQFAEALAKLADDWGLI